jgi:preprotein translocase subunit SecE
MNLDNVKLILSVLIVLGGIAGFYYLDTQPAVVRALTVIGALVAAAVVAYQSAPGKAAWEFAKGSRNELRKVVWPSNKETVQATLAVIAIVILVALYLAAVDWSLGKIYQMLVGQGA